MTSSAYIDQSDLDLLRALIRQDRLTLNTTMPAFIVEYDPGTTKAVVQPGDKRVWPDDTADDLPVIYEVPVLFPCGGGWSMSWGLEPGDTGTLSFCQRSIDRWMASGGTVDPGDDRMHHLTDALFRADLTPWGEREGAEVGRFELIHTSGTRLTVTDDGRFAFANNTAELIALLDQLVSSLITAQMATAVGPATWTPPIVQTLTEVSTKLRTLME